MGKGEFFGHPYRTETEKRCKCLITCLLEQPSPLFPILFVLEIDSPCVQMAPGFELLPEFRIEPVKVRTYCLHICQETVPEQVQCRDGSIK